MLPLVLTGVVLTGGVLEEGVSGSDPVLGTFHAVLAAVCYSGFLYLLRRGGLSGQPVQTYAVVLASCAVISVAVGPWWHGFDVSPGWAALGWLVLVAVFGQLLGWLLVATCSSHLSSDVGAVLLLLTPAGALGLGALLLGERPTPLQLAGCALMLGAAYLATARRSD
jgi:drug/metabolite transporter (DMT)-like permease